MEISHTKILLSNSRNLSVAIVIFFVFAGMARRPMREVEKKVTEQSGVTVQNLSRNPAKAPMRAPEDLAAEQLSLDAAIKIALTNNSEIQAVFQDIGISRADVWQATLFRNPTFEGFVRFPNHDTVGEGDETRSAQNNVELSVSQDFIDVLLMPFKRRIATAEYKAVKLRVADVILSFILEVKRTYYAAQAAEQTRELQKTVLEAAEAAVELGERQLKAGNIKELDFSIEHAAYEETKLEYEKIRAEELLAREPLNQLMGLAGSDAAVWKINSSLPDLPETDPKLEDLETLALSQRLDLAAIREQTKALKRRLSATRFGIIPEAEVGINTEKEVDGGRVTGPTWNVEVPVWDQQLAQGSKVKAQWRQSRFREASYEVKVRSEVRQAMINLEKARTAAEAYRDKIIPDREKIVALYLKDYNYMLSGVYQLLNAKQAEIHARLEYIESIKDYWTSLAALERAVGGKLEKTMDHSQHQGGQS